MLDERIKARILDDHKKLTADGKLPSRCNRSAEPALARMVAWPLDRL